MCGRFGFVYTQIIEELLKQYLLFESDQGTVYKIYSESLRRVRFKTRYDIRPTQTVPVICNNENGNPIFEEMRWGIHPKWSKTPIINARSETLFESRLWKKIIPVQRCLVPASFFYEWQEVAGKKTPYSIHKKQHEIFLFAGLWQSEIYKKTGENENHFSILTQEANEKMKEIHNAGQNKHRQPVILDNDQAKQWLTGSVQEESKIMSMLRIYGSDEIETEALSKIGNDVAAIPPEPLLKNA